MTLAFERPTRPLASVVVVTYGGWRWTRDALEALVRHTDEPFELVVVDNASPDDTADLLRDEVSGAIVVFNDRNLGFGQGANQGARLARGRFLVFLNSDAIVRPGWLRALTDAIDRDPRAGAAVPRYLNVDGTVQEAGGLLFSDGSTLMWGHGAAADDPAFRFRRHVDYGSAACLVVLRSAFRAVGGFDAAYRPMYVEDVDLALALRARGLRSVYEPRAEVEHVRFGSSDLAEERARRFVERNTPILRERWRDVLAMRPPPDVASPVTLHAARDADATPRIFVAASPGAVELVGSLAERYRGGRVTWLIPARLDDEERSRLLARGVEVVETPPDVTAWLEGRLYHYDAAVVSRDLQPSVAAAIADTQPQALRVSVDANVLAELARGGMAPDAVAGAAGR